MKLYKVIEQINGDGKKTFNKLSVLEQTIKLYSKMKKVSKSHRSILDMNMSDVNEIANNDSAVAQSHDKIELKDEMIGILLEKMNSM